jgi:hypothetical protein
VTLRIPIDNHAHKADLDPTEWKPKLRSSHSEASEAYRYLSTFYTRMNQEEGLGRAVRPSHKHSSSMFAVPTLALAPSLVNTPTTVASSFDSLEYDFNTRPLQARRDPMYALSQCVKSDDLVTPHVPPATAQIVAAAENDHKMWGKKMIVQPASLRQEGLGRLLHAADI